MRDDVADETHQVRKEPAPRVTDATVRVRTLRFERDRARRLDSTAPVVRAGMGPGPIIALAALVVLSAAAGAVWALL